MTNTAQNPFKNLEHMSSLKNIIDLTKEKESYEKIFNQKYALGKTPFELIVDMKEQKLNGKVYQIFNYKDNDKLNRSLKASIPNKEKRNKLVNELGELAIKEPILRVFRNLLIHKTDNNKKNKVVHIFDQRFLNLHEYENHFNYDFNSINWNDYVAFEKLDGSLLNVIKYDEDIILMSKGSIINETDSNVKRGLDYLLKQKNLSHKDFYNKLDLDNYNYSFELVSPETKVEVNYKDEKYGLYPIMFRQSNDLMEPNYEGYVEQMKKLANKISIVKEVEIFEGNSKKEIFKNKKPKERYNWEGVVMRNKNLLSPAPLRVKVKPKEYFLTKIFSFANKDIAEGMINKICGKIDDKNYQKKLNKRLNHIGETLTSNDIKNLKELNGYKGLRAKGAIGYKSIIKKLKKLSLNTMIYEILKKYQGDTEEKAELADLLGIKGQDPDGKKMQKKLKNIDQNIEKYKNTNNSFIKKFIESKYNIKNSFDEALTLPGTDNLPSNQAKGRLIGSLKNKRKNNENIKEMIGLIIDFMKKHNKITEYVSKTKDNKSKELEQKIVNDTIGYIKEEKSDWFQE